MGNRIATIGGMALLWVVASLAPAMAHNIKPIVAKNKPSVVGIGVFDPMGSPRYQLQGTGFAIGNGTLVATNFHVVEKALAEGSQQRRVAFIGSGEKPLVANVEILKTDPARDLAILKISSRVPPLPLAKRERLQDGEAIAFTGFPIGAVLGLYPATHVGYIAATSPVAIPSANAQQLSIEMLKRLRKPFTVYQLDATAYPGNSGSPVYELATGKVVAVINKVFVKETKEAAISDPSGITYAIPVEYLHDLLETID